MADVRAFYGELTDTAGTAGTDQVTEEQPGQDKAEETATTPDTTGAGEVTVGTLAAAVLPDYETMARDPVLGPAIQSQIDRRAHALHQAQLKKEESQRSTEERQRRTEQDVAELDRLTEIAMSEDLFAPEGYNDEATTRHHQEITTARAQLRERKEVKRLRTQWEQDELPQLYNWVRETELSTAITTLASQYDEAYAQIPELQRHPELAAIVRHDNFEHGGQWIQALVDRISQVRVQETLAAERERLAKEVDKEVEQRVAAQTAAKMAEYRGRMPSADLTPEAAGTGNGLTFRNQEEVRRAHTAGRLQHMRPYEIRQLLDSLPETSPWGQT